jgi:hypothetical protein
MSSDHDLWDLLVNTDSQLCTHRVFISSNCLVVASGVFICEVRVETNEIWNRANNFVHAIFVVHELMT